MTAHGAWPIERPPIVILGPTGLGKTDAAIALAERIGGEIVGADSMQVYRGFDIGTAKPTDDERARAKFHLLDVADPEQQFTAADWKALAENAIHEIVARGSRPILCGGTGMYLRGLLSNWTFADTASDLHVRERLQRDAAELGSAALHGWLAAVDPVTANRLHVNDSLRIVRALEVWEVSGRALSDMHAEDRSAAVSRAAVRFGLTMPRERIYARTDARVDRMLEAGWIDEVRGLLRAGLHDGPLMGLGYKEIVQYLNGEFDYSTAVETIKQNTRRFAKRQQTWFRGEIGVTWIDASDLSSAEIAERMRAHDVRLAG